MNTKSKSMTALLNLVKAAVFAALIAVMTAYIKFNTGINDGFCADILAGAAAWAPFTAIIKALNALPFALVYTCHATKSPNKILNKTTAFMPLVSGLITIFGYLLAEGLLYSFPTALTSVPFSIIQAVGSAIIYYIAAPALDKVKFKTKLSQRESF